MSLNTKFQGSTRTLPTIQKAVLLRIYATHNAMGTTATSETVGRAERRPPSSTPQKKPLFRRRGGLGRYYCNLRLAYCSTGTLPSALPAVQITINDSLWRAGLLTQNKRHSTVAYNYLHHTNDLLTTSTKQANNRHFTNNRPTDF